MLIKDCVSWQIMAIIIPTFLWSICHWDEVSHMTPLGYILGGVCWHWCTWHALKKCQTNMRLNSHFRYLPKCYLLSLLDSVWSLPATFLSPLFLSMADELWWKSHVPSLCLMSSTGCECNHINWSPMRRNYYYPSFLSSSVLDIWN